MQNADNCTVMRMTASASFFQFALCLVAKIAFCAVQNTMGKLTCRKIENMELWHFESSVA